MESKNKDLSNGISKLLDLQIQRRDGYEKAVMECKGHFPELRLLFSELADESRQFIALLQSKLQNLETDSKPSAEGEISRIWNQTKWAYTGINKEGILAAADETEEIICKAYEDALEAEIEMSSETRQMLISQHQSHVSDADRIKLLKSQDSVPTTK